MTTSRIIAFALVPVNLLIATLSLVALEVYSQNSIQIAAALSGYSSLVEAIQLTCLFFFGISLIAVALLLIAGFGAFSLPRNIVPIPGTNHLLSARTSAGPARSESP